MPDIANESTEDDKKSPEMEETRTSIDRLLEMLKVKGRSELNSIAVTLDVDPRIIENWAKVLENGHLVRITYEVGKMYLEPVNLQPEQQRDLKTKEDFTKFILQEDIAIERISLEKFSKNIEELNNTITNISKVYQTKLPNVRKILDEVDKAYEPLETKRKNMSKIKDEADKDFQEINRKANELYGKIDSFSSKRLSIDMNERLAQLNGVLQSITEAEGAMKESEADKVKFFKSIGDQINEQVKEFKTKLAESRYGIEKMLATNTKQLSELTKDIKEHLKYTQRLSKEMEDYRKELGKARHDLDVLKSDFSDRYAKIKQGMEGDIKIINSESDRMDSAVKSIKDSFGDLSKYDDEIRRWKSNMEAMAHEITMTRAGIIKLETQLNAIDSNKNMPIESKAKAIEELTKEGKDTKEKTAKIKKTIKDTAEEIKDKIEGNK